MASYKDILNSVGDSARDLLGRVETSPAIKGAAYLGSRATAGLVGAVDNIWDYTMGGIYALSGNKEKTKALFDDDKAESVRNFADSIYGEDISNSMIVAGNVAEKIGGALPSVLASSVGAGTISRALSPIISGLQVAGKRTKSAYEETGNIGKSEYKYGAASGAVAYGLNAVANTLRGRIDASISESGKEARKALANEFSDENILGNTLAKNAIKNAVKIFADNFSPIISSSASKAIEGGVSALLDPYIKRATYDSDAQTTIKDVVYSALLQVGFDLLIGTSESNNDSEVGQAAAEKGETEEIMKEAQAVTQMPGDYPATREVTEAYNALSESLSKTGGKVETEEQKQQLGILQRGVAASKIVPLVEESAMSIASYPEAVAEKYRSIGLTDENGNPIEVSAEDLTEGIDLSGTREEQLESVRNALKTNKTFAAIASADAAGRMIANEETEPYREYLRDVSPEQKAQMAADLGVANDDESIAEAMSAYEKTDKAQLRLQRLREIEEMAQASLSLGGMPSVFGSGMQNGAYAYDNGVVVIKGDDGFHLYDKTTGMVSKPLTTAELNAALARGRKQNT